MGHTTKYSAMENISEYTTMEFHHKWRHIGIHHPILNNGVHHHHSQWGSSPTASHWPSSTNVQHGFPLETQTRTTPNSQQGASPREKPQTRKTGGLFNIWGTQRGPNLNETHQSDDDKA